MEGPVATVLPVDMLALESAVVTAGWWWDLDSETVWGSPELSEIIGIEPTTAPLSFELIEGLLPGDRLGGFDRLRAQLRRHPAPFADVYRITRPDGQERHLVVRGWTVRVGDERSRRMLGICRDVTVARSRGRSSARSHGPAVTLPAPVDGVCGIGADGRITFIDQTLPTLLRREGEDIVGRRLHDIVHRDAEGHESHSVTACPFAPDFTESSGTVDVDFHRADGSRSELVFTLVVPPGSEHGGAIVFMRDTAPRRAAAEILLLTRRQVQELSVQRGALLDDLVEAEERERLRIAAELHDDTIQSLAAVALRLSRIGERADSDAGRELLADAEVEVRAAAERLRRLMVGLMGPTIQHDLGDAIAAYCELLFHDSTMSCEIKWDAGHLDGATHLIAYRLVQEAVRNALTHSRGTRVLVSVGHTGSELILGVSDDGIGMGEPHSGPTHVGLRIIRSRAEAAGGSVGFGSGIDGRGVGVELRLPVLRKAPMSAGR